MRRLFLTFFTLFFMHSLSWGSENFTESTIKFSDGSTVTRFHYSDIDSTQTAAKKHLNPGQWSVVTADSQSKGYGFWGRCWESPVGNLFSTFCVHLDMLHMSRLSWVPPFVGLAVSDTLVQLGVPNEKIGLRWINNVLVDEKKIAGIIVETDRKKTGLMLKIGVGINVDVADDVLGAIDQPATSLHQALKTPPSVDDVLKTLVQKLRDRFLAFEECRSPISDYREKLLYLGEEVTIREGNLTMNRKKEKEYNFIETKGTFLGVSDDGFLILGIPDGKKAFISAEVVPRKKDDL